MAAFLPCKTRQYSDALRWLHIRISSEKICQPNLDNINLLKGRFDFLLPESGRLAGLITIVLVVTVPDVITFARTA